MSGIANGLVTVSSAGTAVRFTSATTPLKSILVHATTGNAGNVFVGDSSVDSTNTPPLAPDETLEILFKNVDGETAGDLGDFYVDAANNGDTVTYFAVIL